MPLTATSGPSKWFLNLNLFWLFSASLGGHSDTFDCHTSNLISGGYSYTFDTVKVDTLAWAVPGQENSTMARL